MISTEKTEEPREKPISVPFGPPQIPHELTRSRSLASAVMELVTVSAGLIWFGLTLDNSKVFLNITCGLYEI
jgi:hypothetical protein